MSYDVAVIGLGLIGSAALRHGAVGGRRVIGIGPTEPVHYADHVGAFASHFDSGRITRHLDHSYEWALLAQRAIAEYPVIEATSGIRFHRPAGLLYAAADEVEAAALRAVAAQVGARYSTAETSHDQRMAFADDWVVLAEPAPAGHIDPRRMAAAQLVAAGHADVPATVMRDEALAIEPLSGGRYRVRCRSGAQITAERVLVAAGPHIDEIDGLGPLGPINVRAETVIQAVLDSEEQQRLAGLPSIIAPVPPGSPPNRYDGVYVVPPTDYPDGTVRLKLGSGLLEPLDLPTAEQRREWMRGDDHRTELGVLREFTERLFPGVRALRWETRPCLITDTPTRLPFIERHGDGLVSVAGCNGFAAKSADALGALALRLLVTGVWDDHELRADRFKPLPWSAANGA